MAQRTGRFSSAEAEERFRAAYAEAMADLPDPAATHDVVTDFGRVHVYRFGDQDGVPFVLLPGRSGSTTMWAPNLPAWIAGGTVYAVEILGEAGLSVQERPIRNAEEQACWLAATLADLALDRAHLVGVSFGGWQAVNLALHGSGAVSSLSLIDPACVFGRFPLRLLLASLATLPVAPEFLRTRMLSWISGGVPVDDKPAARVIAASMREFELAVPQPSYPSDDQLRGLHIPTLALIGGRSEIHHPQKAYERARSLLPDGQVELWPEASHAISGEFAAAVNARVLEFVRGVEAR